MTRCGVVAVEPMPPDEPNVHMWSRMPLADGSFWNPSLGRNGDDDIEDDADRIAFSRMRKLISAGFKMNKARKSN
jgi:hypothetical protein